VQRPVLALPAPEVYRAKERSDRAAPGREEFRSASQRRTKAAQAWAKATSSILRVPKFRVPGLFKNRFGMTAASLCLLAAAGPFVAVVTLVTFDPANAAVRVKQLEEKAKGIEVLSADGQWLGVLPRPDVVRESDTVAHGHYHVTLADTRPPPRDLMLMLDKIEGAGSWYNLAWDKLALGIVCSAFEGGHRSFGPLGLHNGRCAGGSTVFETAVKSLVGDYAHTPGRKLAEIEAVLALSRSMPTGSAERNRFVAQNLFMATSEGTRLYGDRATSLAVFGVEPDRLELHQLALLAASPKIPFALTCNGTADSARFERLRNRAAWALRKTFADDPRLTGALAKLAAMAPISRPFAVAIPGKAEPSCEAGASGLLRFEIMDSSARLAAREEVDGLIGSGQSLDAVEIGINEQDASRFKADVVKALTDSARSGRWIPKPDRAEVLAIAMAADRSGVITNLYASGPVQLDVFRQFGSVSKVVAIAGLADAGADVGVRLCDKSVPGLQDPEGGKGHASCSEDGAMMTLATAFGKSKNLAVYDAIRHIDSGRLQALASFAGYRIPANVEPARALAFGMAETTPRQAMTMLQAVAEGAAGRSPRATQLHMIRRYRAGGTWRMAPAPTLDLSEWFGARSARAIFALAASAPLRPHGTLAATTTRVALGPEEVAKSGTSGTKQFTTGKFAVGANQDGAWLSMVVPLRGGNLASGVANTTAISRVARESSLHELTGKPNDTEAW